MNRTLKMAVLAVVVAGTTWSPSSADAQGPVINLPVTGTWVTFAGPGGPPITLNFLPADGRDNAGLMSGTVIGTGGNGRYSYRYLGPNSGWLYITVNGMVNVIYVQFLPGGNRMEWQAAGATQIWQKSL